MQQRGYDSAGVVYWFGHCYKGAYSQDCLLQWFASVGLWVEEEEERPDEGATDDEQRPAAVVLRAPPTEFDEVRASHNTRIE
jgi:hypothetical protein